MKFVSRSLLLAALLGLLSAGRAQAQAISPDSQRSSKKVLQAFRAVVERPSASAARVLCDGRAVALGAVVSADGWIITKASVLTGKVKCKLKDGRELAAKIIGVHEPYDLALLKIDATELTPVAWCPSAEATVGRWVASVGPTGEPVAIGVVSVATRKYKPGDQPPKNTNNRSGYLGVGLAEGEGGAKIIGVMKGSPADRAGLKVEDVVIEADGKKVLDNESLVNRIQRHRPGDVVTMKVRRGKMNLELKAKLGRLPRAMLGNPQERMGNALSNRRGGFPTILQHDTVLKPAECGGPLVDLDGKVVGINIARAGRTESYAVPAEAVMTLLGDLKSGKLKPVEEEAPTQPPAIEKKIDPKALLSKVGNLTAREPRDRVRKGSASRSYEIKLAQGEEYAVEAESVDFDVHVRVEAPDGKAVVSKSSGSDVATRVTFRAPRAGTYRVVVATTHPGDTGAYIVTVRKTDGPRPKIEKK